MSNIILSFIMANEAIGVAKAGNFGELCSIIKPVSNP